MAYPPPPGHASLPPKPPPSTIVLSAKPNHNGFKPAFTAFAPRAVASATNTAKHNPPAQYSAPPAPSYPAHASYSAAAQPSYQTEGPYNPAPQAPGSTPQIKNPFVSAGIPSNTSSSYGNYDPEYEAQLQQWQSAYTNRDDKPAHNRSAVPAAKNDTTGHVGKETQKTVERSGGGTTWSDDTLLEWDPAHFRIFVGNLAGEVTDDSLLKAFAKYPSVQKARVIRDRRTTKSKGYGFVSFANGDEYFQAAKDMQGKYIGSHPVLIKRAMTEVRPTSVHHNKGKNKNKNKGAGGHNKVEHGGVEKKASKTKNGLRVLG